MLQLQSSEKDWLSRFNTYLMTKDNKYKLDYTQNEYIPLHFLSLYQFVIVKTNIFEPERLCVGAKQIIEKNNIHLILLDRFNNTTTKLTNNNSNLSSLIKYRKDEDYIENIFKIDNIDYSSVLQIPMISYTNPTCNFVMGDAFTSNKVIYHVCRAQYSLGYINKLETYYSPNMVLSIMVKPGYVEYILFKMLLSYYGKGQNVMPLNLDSEAFEFWYSEEFINNCKSSVFTRAYNTYFDMFEEYGLKSRAVTEKDFVKCIQPYTIPSGKLEDSQTKLEKLKEIVYA